MKEKIIDISVSITREMPLWPKSLKPHFKHVFSHKKGDIWTQTEINIDLHTGTHIDAPLHRIKGGASVDKLDLEIMVGRVFVAHLPKIKAITSRDLDNLNLPKGTTRLLFKTSNSKFWSKRKLGFQKKFVALTADGARWLVNNKIKLVGNDYLSIGPFSETGEVQAEVHCILLKSGIIVLEGLNLSGVKQGVYQLICLPLKLAGLEASPVRAVLIKL